MSDRELLFSVTLDDCVLQHFRAGGKGGQHQNKTDSGTRIIHEPSGARGESREGRSQLQNKKNAFRRMTEQPAFTWWVAQETRRLRGELSTEAVVDGMLADPKQTRVEVKDANGRWVEVDPSELKDYEATVTGTRVSVRTK